MRVLVYIDDLSIKGGGERVAMYFLKALLRNGIDTYFLTLTEVNTFEEINAYYRKNPGKFFKGWTFSRLLYIIPKKTKIISIALDYIFLISTCLQLFLVNRKAKPDAYIVIVNTTCQNAPFILHGKPIISWGLTPFKKKWTLPLHNILLELGLRKGWLILVVGSKRQKQASDREYGIYAKVITVGYDDEWFKYCGGRKVRNKIVYIARISPEKRVELAIEAAKLLKEKYDDFKLIIVGYPQNRRYYRRLKKLIAEYDLSNNVKLLPEDSPTVIRENLLEAEVFWNFSEGYGGVVNYEALACGCIPVFSRNFKDQIGGHGYVVNSVEEAVEATVKILEMDDEEKRKQALECSRYARKFSRSIFEKKFVNLIRLVVGRS